MHGNINRWLIAGMGVLLQMCLGTVYAWSFFQNPLMEHGNWSNSQVAWVFSLAILFLSLGAAFGGRVMASSGPRVLAVSGSLLFSGGYFLAAVALHFKLLWLLYLGYGVIGGLGLGLGYVTPVAVVAKWFPDKKGLATGMVVMGFGLGALVMSKLLAPYLMALTGNNLAMVFGTLGAIFVLLSLPPALCMINPAVGNVPVGVGSEQNNESNMGAGAWGAFSRMWLFFFCNIVAGIMLIGFQSPMLQDLLKLRDASAIATQLTAAGATLIAVSSIFNGLGRFFWGGLSDRIGRIAAFRFMLSSQFLVFVVLAVVGSKINPWLFGLLVCYVLFCYGGGFGTMPSLVLDRFGARRMPAMYGLVLTAWGTAGIVGPQVAAMIKDRLPEQAAMWSFAIGAGLLLTGLAATLGFASHKQAVHI